MDGPRHNNAITHHSLTPKSSSKLLKAVALQNTAKTTMTVIMVFRTFTSVLDRPPPVAALQKWARVE